MAAAALWLSNSTCTLPVSHVTSRLERARPSPRCQLGEGDIKGLMFGFRRQGGSCCHDFISLAVGNVEAYWQVLPKESDQY